MANKETQEQELTAAPETTNAPVKAETMQLAVSEEAIAQLDKIAAFGAEASGIASQFKRIFTVGAVVQQLRALLTPKVMQTIMALQNSPLGFMTDRPGTGYDVDTVRDCVIEAAIQHVGVCGNEFNILAGRFYLTKNGCKRKLMDIPGLYCNVTPGIPRTVGENGAVVKMTIEWTINGNSKKLRSSSLSG